MEHPLVIVGFTSLLGDFSHWLVYEKPQSGENDLTCEIIEYPW